MYAIFFHAHQKLDRVARRHLSELLPKNEVFPSARQIIYFEGRHGPDSSNLKRQTTGEQPWHFVDPHDDSDIDLEVQITNHWNELVKQLTLKDNVRAAFESAWLAHALVDGLTPAHHYPYEAELASLRGGESRHTRRGLAGRVYVKADTLRETVSKSLRLVGPGGLLTNHAMFEAGAYSVIVPLSLNSARPSAEELEHVSAVGILPVFRDYAKQVAVLRLYDRFLSTGWTPKLGHAVRRDLAPRMARIITLGWYSAYNQAFNAGVQESRA